MTATQTLTGRDIGQAEKATRAVLDRLLTESSTTFHQWVAVNVLALHGGALDRVALVAQMTGGLKIAEADVVAVVDELVALGLVRGRAGASPSLELTEAGRRRHEEVQAGIDGITERLYGDLPVEDLVVARRVLAAVTERANDLLAS